MKKPIALAGALLATAAHAYTPSELFTDCQAVDGAPGTPAAARCLAYFDGFADGYAVGDYLASKVGVQLGAICVPRGGELNERLARAALIQLERMPPNSQSSTSTIVAGALAKAFPCTDSLEPKK